MELLTLTTKDVRRLEVLSALEAGNLRQAEAAKTLHLSVRQIKRLWRRYRSGGASALVSKKRGKPPNNALDPSVKGRVLELYRTHYADFGPTLAVEKLRDRDGIVISRETLRKWLIAEMMWRPSKRRAKPRPPRARRACFGELVQIDGSPHAWFENRGSRCTLLVAIDDATGIIGAAHFACAETTDAYFQLFKKYFDLHGLPEAFYSDRHSIFRINTPLSEERQTQLSRAVHELDIELICANSPQAKGRVERANRTLQDRLVKELRLNGIDTIDEGNEFLATFIPGYNAQFAREPEMNFDAHRSIAPFNLDAILCQREERVLTKNGTVQVGNCIFALTGSRQLCTGARVALHIQRGGEISFSYNGLPIEHRLIKRLERNAAIVSAKELADRPAKSRNMPQRAHPAAPHHPWRTPWPKPPGDISALQSGDIKALR